MDPYDVLQWLLLFLELTALLNFIRYIVKLSKTCKFEREYQITVSLTSITLSLFSKITLRTWSIIMIESSEYSSILNYQNEVTDKNDLAICTYRLANSLSVFFFCIWILANSIRWLHLILLQSNSRLMRKTEVCQYITQGISISLVLGISIFKMVYLCNEADGKIYVFSVLLSILLTIFLTIFSASAYIYAGCFFSQLYKKQVISHLQLNRSSQARKIQHDITFL